MRPVCYDLFCGLGGWAEGFLAEGWRVVGFDIEAHDYGTGGYPGGLVLRDIRSIHGSELKDADCIVASPPCQAYSYRAMPWKRAKALPPPDNTLFNECFRIQREAIAAAGHYIPMVVENVRGAQKWVGRAQWNYGSFYLWGDMPALMPLTLKKKLKTIGPESPEQSTLYNCHINEMRDGYKMNFHEHEKTGKPGRSFQSCAVEETGLKQPGLSGLRENGKGDKWFQDGAARHGSKSNSRKAASAMIAKIPFPLAQWIARAYRPREKEATA